MNRFRLSKPLYVVLLLALAACQAQPTPSAPTAVPPSTAAPTAVPPTAVPTLAPTNADAIAGTWSGIAKNGDFTYQVTITIGQSCAIGSVCGPFDLPSIPCSGTFTLIGISGATYQLQAGDLQGSCDPEPGGSDFLELLSDGTLLYTTRGSFGESKGVLQTAAPTTATIPQSSYPLLIEYKIPTSSAHAGGITVGPDGAIWFVETGVNQIGRISTDGVITEYPVPTAGGIDDSQGFIGVGSDGALWFNEDLVNKIGRITTKGEVTEYALPAELAPANDPTPIRAMVTGPDGALWVTSPGANAIVKLTLDGKIAVKYPLPKAESVPVGMVVGPDGALWFAEAGANQIGRITLDGKLSEYPLPENSKPLRLTVGSDKAIWFTMVNTNKIGRISADGKVTEFDAAGMGPVGITSGADGALWFTGYNSSEIGRLTTDGVLTKLAVPTSSSVPYHITASPDGSLWFTEMQGNMIGQIQLSAPMAAQASSTQPPTVTPLSATVIAEWTIVNPEDIVFGFDSVWVPSRRSPNVTTRIDPVSNEVIAVIQGTGNLAKSAAVTGDSVWIAGQSSDLAPIDPKTNTIGTKVPGNHPRITYGFNSIWAVGHQGEPLDRVDPANSKIIVSIPLSGTVSDSGEENDVLVTALAVWVIANGELIKIDPATNSVVLRTTLDKVAAEAKAQTSVPAGKGADFLWIPWNAGLLRLDPNTGAGLTLLPNVTGAIAVTDEVVWVGGYDGQLVRMIVATNQIDTTYKIHLGATKVGIGFGSVWVAYENHGLVQRLDVAP